MKGVGGAGLLDVHLWPRAALGYPVFVVTGMPPCADEERGARVLWLCSPCHIERVGRRTLPGCHEGDNWAEGYDTSLTSGVFRGLCHISPWKSGLALRPHQSPSYQLDQSNSLMSAINDDSYGSLQLSHVSRWPGSG